MRVFVVNMRGEPLMPTTNQKARKLLKLGKAKIYRYNPFTIQLLYATGETTQPVNVGIDTGARMIGVAITSEDKIFAKGEVELRQDISDNIRARAALRKARRGRKTRYRQARFLNRKRPAGWLPPSVQSKLNATILWIDRFCSLVPSPRLSIEVGKFNLLKMIGAKSSEIEAKDYFDVRYYVFTRDEYTCQVCKKKNKILRTHHLVFKSCGGTNRADNLITVCADCHTSENHKPGGILYRWMKDSKKVRQYKDPTFMNIVRKRTSTIYPNARITYGSETSPRRISIGLEKTHYNDAIAISEIDIIIDNPLEHFYYKQFRKKKRSLHESIPRKGLTNKNTEAKRFNKNVKYRNGYYLNDEVIFRGHHGWVYGYSGGIKGKEFLIRDIQGDIIKVPERKNSLSIPLKSLKLAKHNNSWQYAIIHRCEGGVA